MKGCFIYYNKETNDIRDSGGKKVARNWADEKLASMEIQHILK